MAASSSSQPPSPPFSYSMNGSHYMAPSSSSQPPSHPFSYSMNGSHYQQTPRILYDNGGYYGQHEIVNSSYYEQTPTVLYDNGGYYGQHEDVYGSQYEQIPRILYDNNGGYYRKDEERDDLAWKRSLPVGVRFSPTAAELIHDYLVVRASGREIYPAGIIGKADVYKHHPKEFAGVGGIQHDGDKTYFFTHVRGKDNSSKKCERRVIKGGAEIGFWKATQAREYVFPSGNGRDKRPIGTRTPLAYHEIRYVNGQRMPVKSNWLMTEFRLPQKNGGSDNERELVLCVVYSNEQAKKGDHLSE